MPFPIKVLYEDDWFIAFDKPAGLLVVPSPQQETSTLMHLVNNPALGFKKGVRLFPCHRLDRDTSGVIIFAKGKSNQQRMRDVFKNRKIQKTYLAFVQGRVRTPQGEIKSVIKDYYQRKFFKRQQGRLAVTHYKVLEVRKRFSILEVHPITGRTNQIRIQLCDAGHPIVGERRYAFGKDFDLKFRRTALHAQALQWVHPLTKKSIKVTSPLPSDMEVFLARNRD
jgi:RluA family pseudouridine synthase